MFDLIGDGLSINIVPLFFQGFEDPCLRQERNATVFLPENETENQNNPPDRERWTGSVR